MRELFRSVARVVGLERPARQTWRALRARGWTPWWPLVPEDAFCDCVRQAVAKLQELEPSERLGDYLEFGVSRGTSLACTYRTLRDAGLNHMRLIGFDSFEGLPVEADKEGWAKGEFHSTIQATRNYLKRQQVDLGRITLVKGWFKDTLTEETRRHHAIEKASLIMIDCDIYSASKDALNFSEPHIHNQAVVMFDDWGWREEQNEVGQKEAFGEFLADHSDLIAEPMPSYLPQARVFLVRRGP
ncbi:class I SAM-dependent methyltransferase [Rhizobium sp. 007]|nr:TylF/MycF/NovP-related O-methyltransferase [Rhizobium sp. 007]OWK25099.1 hypothetical protein AJ87_14545 [Rhizobium yanglingense]QPB21337.1 class I SAM-dependent methyltransferase [Rhizobium sp. 007]